MKKTAFYTAIILMAIACNYPDIHNKNKLNTDEETDYIRQGDSISKITFDTLRATLLKTIGEKGFSGALVFCNVRALPVTSTYASEGITISRISDKNRNPKNELSESDKREWARYIDLAAKKDSLKSRVVSRNNEFHYYKPILMQPMCLNCHGTPGKEISKELLTVIDSLYPSDKAIGYKQGDLRGMWHIVFKNRMADKK